MARTYCDWCGAYCECEECDDPAVKKAWWEMDNPMQHHIHSCCDEPELCTGCNYGEPDCKCNGSDDSTRGDGQDIATVCDGPVDNDAFCAVCKQA